MGLPAEKYMFGVQGSYHILCNLSTALIGNYVIFPVFMKVELTSINEVIFLKSIIKILYFTSFNPAEHCLKFEKFVSGKFDNFSILLFCWKLWG